MPFVTIAGVTGRVYVPKKSSCMPCKHPCADCYSCQFCSDDRCSVCRGLYLLSEKSRKASSIRSTVEKKPQLPARKK